MTISGERTEQLNTFCHITGFMSDFLSFIDVELIRFFHGALHMLVLVSKRYLLYQHQEWCSQTGVNQVTKPAIKQNTAYFIHL